jgi:periplasmic protein TonB
MSFASPEANGTMNLSSCGPRGSSPLKPLVGVAAATVIHGLALWLILSGLGREIVTILKPPVISYLLPPEPPPKAPDPAKQAKPNTPRTTQTFVKQPEITPPVTDSTPIIETVPAPSDVYTTPQQPSTSVPSDPPGPRGIGSISNRAACLAAFRDSFPREARRSRQEGSVTIAARISPDGHVIGAEVVASNPRRVFDREALGVLNSGVCRFDTATSAYHWQAEVSYRLQGESAD